MQLTPRSGRISGVILCVGLLLGAEAVAQQAAPAAGASAAGKNDSRYSELEQQMQTVLATLDDTRRQLRESEERIDQLQGQLKLLQAQRSGESDAASLETAVSELKDETEILQSEVKQHEQSKVESVSKFPVRIYGMVLFTTYANDGVVDNRVAPASAWPRMNGVANNSFGASVSQSILGLRAYGPRIWGAKSTGDVEMDFFNGAYGSPSPTAIYARFRTGHFGLDWTNTSASVGVDSPLISPRNPTSYATVGEPALSWSGNLWNWLPQLKVEQRLPISATSHVGLEFGLIDPQYSLPGQPAGYTTEISARPGYESRVSYNWQRGDDIYGIGAGAYYSWSRYPYDQKINAWAFTADWNLPLQKWVLFSGELYHGSALGDLGGGGFKDVIPQASDSDYVAALGSEGGWSQLKLRWGQQFEGNFAIGQDTAYGNQVRKAAIPAMPSTMPYWSLARNRTIMENFIYKPRTYLLFSVEHRNIESWRAIAPSNQAQVWTLSAGYLF
jgi:hypothetical protein